MRHKFKYNTQTQNIYRQFQDNVSYTIVLPNHLKIIIHSFHFQPTNKSWKKKTDLLFCYLYIKITGENNSALFFFLIWSQNLKIGNDLKGYWLNSIWIFYLFDLEVLVVLLLPFSHGSRCDSGAVRCDKSLTPSLWQHLPHLITIRKSQSCDI